MKIRLADYIFQRLPALTGSDHCFFLSGGGIMHLTDAMRISSVHPVPMHHEQAAVIAADSFGRVHNTVGIALVTTGPGGTNAITGVAGAWMESTPLIVISGQVSRATWKWDSGVRQLGFQEIDILPIVRPITKYSAIVLDPKEIRYHLEKAIYISKSGRPGPVWLDIPLDVQGAVVDEDEMKPFFPSELRAEAEPIQETQLKVEALVSLLTKAERPLILGGHGVWLSGSKPLFRQLVEKLGFPVQTTWNGLDLIEDDHPLFFGRANSYGPRYANFIIQNCDLLISIGARLGIQHIGYNYRAFAREAFKVMVDIDQAEIKKYTLKIDLPIHTDVRVFLETLRDALEKSPVVLPKPSWLGWCKKIKQQFPVCGLEYYKEDDYVDPYAFFDQLSSCLSEGALIVPGSSGTGFSTSHQVFRAKRGQRFISWKGLAAMGFGLPSSIGACFAYGRKQTVTVIGDGGFQLNIQDLATIAGNSLPIKLFVFSNQGYLSIRATQGSYFGGQLIGSSADSGVWLPPLEKVAETYSLAFRRIERNSRLQSEIASVLAQPGPVLCEVMMNPDKPPLPKLGSRKRADGTMESNPLEELIPPLPREEFVNAMLIRPWEDSV